MQAREKFILAFIADAKDAINEADHSINFVISSDRLDRHNERVEVSAVADAIGGFAANPVALACHLHRLSDGRSPVIGSWDTATFRARAHTSEMRLRFCIDTELGKEYWTLYSQKHMRAVSVGIRILDGHEEVKEGSRIFIITKLELLEISCVPVGANREALSKHKALYSEYADLELSEPRTSEGVFNSDPLKTLLAEQLTTLTGRLDEIKELITLALPGSDSGSFAAALLSEAADPAEPRADRDDAELIQKGFNAFCRALANLKCKPTKGEPKP